MSALERAVRDLVIANRVLANEGVLDAYGHVSVRHPDDPQRYLLSRSLGPEHVTPDDIVEFTLDGTAVSDDRPPYLERFIHGAVYAARPEVDCVVHGHTAAVLPYTITDVPLRAVVHDASDIGSEIPLWDIREEFGDGTDMLVRTAEMGESLARRLGAHSVVLMRGHGFAAAGRSLVMTVRMCVYLGRNAQVQTIAAAMGGEVVALTDAEIGARRAYDPESPAMRRGWNAWAERAGCADLLDGQGAP
ncbi:ribulose-5-phosphate 4-epimerase/fuculose-1-phosphate aldolase [Pseudonocardia hierapolitana]|uniref:Ribulose-5-phosphate 4-epimerase/fuculose-1-phosphate aldolase n=1 Tax=Pseudonocardia hierapolitana TaxID=1128676 RepID=A0A561SJU0_9PSEU|nr:class II aldolase/adducin family protein [Pseudonocardia hierapolitana]TWF75119.1 ribulose-5-phosphate 4-epimerase/fuculose-1-phosphate aldolase [Pseudonocardia hierapolitana]